MDFKWLLVLILLGFGALIYYKDDLQGLGGASSGSEVELERLESKPATPRPVGQDEPSTPKD